MVSLVITRPLETGKPLASALAARGATVFCEPMLSIYKVMAPLFPEKRPDALLLTSANALQKGIDYTPFLTIPCYCVGPVTLEKAKAFGFEKAQTAQGDGQSLARLVAACLPPAARLLHICATNQPSTAAQGLEMLGYQVDVWPVYEVGEATAFSDAFQEQLAAQAFDAVLFFSPRTAQVFERLLDESALRTCCSALSAIGLSEAVLSVLKTSCWGRLVVAPAKTEEAMCELITGLFDLKAAP